MKTNHAKLFITICLYVWVISDSFIRVSTHLCFVVWNIFLCEMIRSRGTSQIYFMSLSYVWYDSFIYMCGNPFSCVKQFVPVVLLRYMSCLFHMCEMTHSFICVSTHLHLWNGSFPYDFSSDVTWCIHMCVVTLIWMHQVTWCNTMHSYVVNESYHTYKRFTTHIWMHHVTWLFYECISHEPPMNASCYNDTHLNASCNLMHSYVCRDSFTCVIWLIHVRDMTRMNLVPSQLDHISAKVLCVTCLFLMWRDSFPCSMTHPYVCHDSLICLTWLIHTRDMTHLFMWHDSYEAGALPTRPCQGVVCDMTRLDIYSKKSHSHLQWKNSFFCNMTHSYVWNDSFIRVIWLI